jgi:hypothetical protein
MLAGVSVDYYTRLERGNATGVSDSVLFGIARALQLDDAERAHLFDLARALHPSPRPARRRSQKIRPSIQRLLDAVTVPAFVRNNHLDILASNLVGRALYFVPEDGRVRSTNTARFTFLDPRAKTFYVDWERSADDVVAVLRSEAGKDPYDKALTDLVGELSTQSAEFRAKWAMHNVRFHDTGIKRLQHPIVGRLDLNFEAFQIAAEGSLTMFAYTAEPESASADALAALTRLVDSGELLSAKSDSPAVA